MPRRARLLARAAGRFGPLRVVDADGARRLVCAGHIQGASCLRPATRADRRRWSPGAVPDAPYQLAWLLPALAAPRGRLLMTGLGCGSGVCLLLHHCPALAIDVVEADPAVVRLALAHWPLLAHHVARGACRIVPGTVAAALAGRGTWDAALLDTYAGRAGLVCAARDLRALRGRVGGCWLNVAGEGGARVIAALGLLRRGGWTPALALPVRFADGGYAGNTILATTAMPSAVIGFTAFAGLRHPAAVRARREFALLRDGAFAPV